jgi:hypothetical protein
MIRSLLAASLTGLVTFAYLMVYEWTKFTTPVAAYFIAGVIATAGHLLWPAVVLFFLHRRRKNKQEAEQAAQVQAEVDKQMASQKNG